MAIAKKIYFYLSSEYVGNKLMFNEMKIHSAQSASSHQVSNSFKGTFKPVSCSCNAHAFTAEHKELLLVLCVHSVKDTINAWTWTLIPTYQSNHVHAPRLFDLFFAG